MPIYEYRCESCQHELELIRKISDPPLADCPACGRPQLKKRVSAAAFRLKGGGWYETDFKTGDKKNIAGGADAAKPASGSDSAGGASGAATTKASSGSSTDSNSTATG